jgi:YD repeat-containing protein
MGNRIAVIDPNGKRTTTIYDSMGRISAVWNALGQRATQTYLCPGQYQTADFFERELLPIAPVSAPRLAVAA